MSARVLGSVCRAFRERGSGVFTYWATDGTPARGVASADSSPLSNQQDCRFDHEMQIVLNMLIYWGGGIKKVMKLVHGLRPLKLMD
jgi:hypothetical protein